MCELKKGILMKRLSLPGLAVGCVILFYEVYKFSKEVRKNNTKENSDSCDDFDSDVETSGSDKSDE